MFSQGAMRVLHTPGHTPGSCCFLFPGFAITGDTLLNRKIGRTDLPGCDRRALIASVDLLLLSTDDEDLLYAGHREPWRVKEARHWWAHARENAPSLDSFEPESLRDRVPE
jgi:glyoxylase-like metal-dependent hydrolase (beta-lactamase superfamily II)